MIQDREMVGDESRIASFSECRRYRYCLDIDWEAGSPRLVTIGLNPSTADHLRDDPTIRRGKSLAKRLGCGRYRMLNIFALRATNPNDLQAESDPVGEGNTIPFLASMVGDVTVACWGGHMRRAWPFRYRGHDIAASIPGLSCLRRTRDGDPSHLLYLPDNLGLEPFAYV